MAQNYSKKHSLHQLFTNSPLFTHQAFPGAAFSLLQSYSDVHLQTEINNAIKLSKGTSLPTLSAIVVHFDLLVFLWFLLSHNLFVQNDD